MKPKTTNPTADQLCTKCRERLRSTAYLKPFSEVAHYAKLESTLCGQCEREVLFLKERHEPKRDLRTNQSLFVWA